jgi:hypothetical protein
MPKYCKTTWHFFFPHLNVGNFKLKKKKLSKWGNFFCQEDARIVKVLPYWGRKTKEQ